MADMKVGIRIGATMDGSVGAVVGKTVRRLDRLKGAQRDLAAAQERLSARRGALFDAFATGTVLAAPFVGATRAAIGFESVMADVRKVVDFETPAQFQVMSRDILGLSAIVPVAASGLGDIMAAAGQAGIARGELLRFTEDASKMAVAFDISGEEAGARMTGLRSIFKLSQDDVMSLAGTINHLSNNMDATAPAMLNVMERAGGMAPLFGLTAQETGALAASFLALKTRPEVAGTAINAMLRILADAPNQSRKFHDALDELGLSAEELKLDIEQDAQGALLRLFETIGDAEDKVPILSALFGAEYADDIAKLSGNLDIYRNALGLSADRQAAATSVLEEYRARAATTENNLQLLANKTNVLAVNVGDALLPAVNSAVDILGNLVMTGAGLAAEFPGVTTAVVTLAGGLAILTVGGALAGYASALVSVGWARTRIAAFRAMDGAAALGQGLVRLSDGGMAMAGRGARGLGRGFRGVARAAARPGDVVRGLGRTLTDFTDGASARGRSGLGRLRGAFASVGWAIRNPRAAVGGFGRGLVGLARDGIPAAVRGLGILRLALISTGVGAIVVGLGTAAALIIKYWEPIGAFFSGFGRGFQAAFAPVFDTFPGLRKLFTGIGDVISWIWDLFAGLFKPVDATAEQMEAFGDVGERIGEIVGTVFKELFDIVGKVIIGIGKVLNLVGLGGDEDEDEDRPRPRGPRRRPGASPTAGATVNDEDAETPAVGAPQSPGAATPTTAGATVAGRTPASAFDKPVLTPTVFEDGTIVAPVDATGPGLAIPRPEVDPEAVAANVEAEVGALFGDGADTEEAWDNIGRDLADLEQRGSPAGDTDAIGGPGSDFALRVDEGGLAPSFVFHQVFEIYASGEDLDREIQRRVAQAMRQASTQAGLVEAEETF